MAEQRRFLSLGHSDQLVVKSPAALGIMLRYPYEQPRILRTSPS
jgi:hypothetical protein